MRTLFARIHAISIPLPEEFVMTTARKDLVDVEVTRYYHCISRCVRQAYLCGESFEYRKQWIEDRLELLAKNFSISVAGFAVMDNHMHVLCRLDPKEADSWSAEEVLRRWLAIYPPRNVSIDDPEAVAMWVTRRSQDHKQVEIYRARLQNLGWFMKSLKEPLARRANREDQCKGSFWEARFKSIAVLDEEALLATCAYIDLNPLAAGQATVPEQAEYTSVRQRVAHVRQQGQLTRLSAAKRGSVAASQAAGNIDQDHWLLPIEDRRQHTNAQPASKREGMLDSFSLGSYLLLVDYTGRLFRTGKARIDDGVNEIFQRFGTSQEIWGDRMKKMLSSRALYGRFFAADRIKLTALAQRRGQHHLANLSPQLAS